MHVGRRTCSILGAALPLQVTTSDLRQQVGRIQNQVKEIQEVVRMYSSTTGPRRVRRTKVETMSAEATDTNVRNAALGADRAARASRVVPHTSCNPQSLSAALLAPHGPQNHGRGEELRAYP